jgi:hypothetical protein
MKKNQKTRKQIKKAGKSQIKIHPRPCFATSSTVKTTNRYQRRAFPRSEMLEEQLHADFRLLRKSLCHTIEQ